MDFDALVTALMHHALYRLIAVTDLTSIPVTTIIIECKGLLKRWTAGPEPRFKALQSKEYENKGNWKKLEESMEILENFNQTLAFQLDEAGTTLYYLHHSVARPWGELIADTSYRTTAEDVIKFCDGIVAHKFLRFEKRAEYEKSEVPKIGMVFTFNCDLSVSIVLLIFSALSFHIGQSFACFNHND
ncbi:hypothetical protein M7I_0235 [Glarea lozoyensis 74030]|uniref:Uncharacterized protein n=1 Tax=Glarea lozoyensis (strain ATCC 74030 / MF5533) TaxID=1104152 RepID=H0ECU0_GLAL7|nr:hypothetical protein M7I_0235 [Glarea lozoyensis 74030]